MEEWGRLNGKIKTGNQFEQKEKDFCDKFWKEFYFVKNLLARHFSLLYEKDIFLPLNKHPEHLIGHLQYLILC